MVPDNFSKQSILTEYPTNAACNFVPTKVTSTAFLLLRSLMPCLGASP